MDNIGERSHTARILLAMSHEYQVKARNEARDGKIHDSKRIAELTGEYLAWLQEQRQK